MISLTDIRNHGVFCGFRKHIYPIKAIKNIYFVLYIDFGNDCCFLLSLLNFHWNKLKYIYIYIKNFIQSHEKLNNIQCHKREAYIHIIIFMSLFGIIQNSEV